MAQLSATRLTFHFTTACTGCGACLLTCPQHAIRPGVGGPLIVLADRCDECAECIEVCPADAIVELVERCQPGGGPQ